MEAETTTIIIRGIAYKVIQSKTPDQHEAEGLTNLARHMRQNKIKRAMYAKRPHGSALYMLYEFDNGNYSKLIKIPHLKG